MKKRIIIISLIVIIIAPILQILSYYNLLPKKSYNAKDFNIKTIYSTVDFNSNGKDDYTDILLGARMDAKSRPKYDSAYHSGGYPPENIGVCTDVIWRAFKNAGYSLKDMVDSDILRRPEAYKNIEKPDSNIDFRRVRNLHTFFDEYAISLTTDTDDIDQFQPGDIVIFGMDKHIGIVSDKRNKDGKPYIIHNGGQPNREEDYLKRDSVSAHYRFDASQIDPDILISWQ